MGLTTRQLLIAGRGLFARHRTGDAYARNAAGVPVAPDDPSAVCFCAYGALQRVSRGTAAMTPHQRELERGGLRDARAEDALFKACIKLADRGPIDLNDTDNNPDLILRAYDLAIERA